jgi:hypothetical protein
MPQSFMVPGSLLTHYCPQLQPSPSLSTHPYVLETTRAILTLFFGWLYTGKVDTNGWYELTELYFLGHAAGCVALMRSAISQLQKACRNDETNHTELFHYEHISVIEEMVGATSPLSRYVEDTYFNHWRASVDDVVSDDPSKHPKSNSFFKKLFERSIREQREIENCSCCHDFCKYHDHTEAERLASKFSLMRITTFEKHANCFKHVDALRLRLQIPRSTLLRLPSSRILWFVYLARESPCADPPSVSSCQPATTLFCTRLEPTTLVPAHQGKRLLTRLGSKYRAVLLLTTLPTTMG